VRLRKTSRLYPGFRNASVLGCLKSLSSYSEGINPWLPPPPPPRSFGIIGLGRNSSQIFEFKGLIRKIFRNKDLGCQRALKIGLGAASRAVLVDGYTSKLPQSDLYRHARRVLSQWISITDGCDERGNVPSFHGLPVPGLPYFEYVVFTAARH
jgi:hypothetical protein